MMKRFMGDDVFAVIDLMFKHGAAKYMPQSAPAQSYIIRTYMQRKQRTHTRIADALLKIYWDVTYLAQAVL